MLFDGALSDRDPIQHQDTCKDCSRCRDRTEPIQFLTLSQVRIACSVEFSFVAVV